MRFSHRTPDDLSSNPITLALEAMQNQEIYNLTLSNPTLCGFNYPRPLLNGFSKPESLVYEPNPFGTLKSRETLAQYLSSAERRVRPENLLLTASTSEAYSYLFKLLGDPGDSFLVPTPGYPLLDHLLHLEGLKLNTYPFHVQPNWPVDLPQLKAALTSQIKGIIVVNPHNPTGAFLSEQDQQALLSICEERSIAYISDEVFGDYAYGAKPQTVQNDQVLSFRLGGLSKSLGLPQLKLSWMEIQGPAQLVDECKNRLELIADTYLSVNTPVQTALADLLAFSPNLQKQIKTRVLENRQRLEKALAGLASVKVWPVQGGWYVLVEVLLESVKDEDLAIKLLNEHRVLVQPGMFYDFPNGCFLVLSLLPQLNLFETGVMRLRQFFERLN